MYLAYVDAIMTRLEPVKWRAKVLVEEGSIWAGAGENGEPVVFAYGSVFVAGPGGSIIETTRKIVRTIDPDLGVVATRDIIDPTMN
jgi:hypothetical protein